MAESKGTSSLRGRAGAPYSSPTKGELDKASRQGLPITLTMIGTQRRITLSAIGNVKATNRGEAQLTFTCKDVTGTTYKGTVTTRGFTTFVPN